MYWQVAGETSFPSAHSCITGHCPQGMSFSGAESGIAMNRLENTASSSPCCSSICKRLQFRQTSGNLVGNVMHTS